MVRRNGGNSGRRNAIKMTDVAISDTESAIRNEMKEYLTLEYLMKSGVLSDIPWL
jgi:hypothetical protein